MMEFKDFFLKFKKRKKNRILSHKGMATIETVALLPIFVVILSYQLGLFGAIHSGILNSIAARTFTFETFRNRADLTYYRENLVSSSGAEHYEKSEIRWHSVVTENIGGSVLFKASARPVSTFSIGSQSIQNLGTASQHNNIYTLHSRNRKIEVNPIWVMVGYGMCLNVQCGDP